jgi:hypothetical protein
MGDEQSSPLQLTETAIFMSQNPGRFDGTVGTEDTQDGRRSRGGRNGSNPEGSGWGRLQLHSSHTGVGTRRLGSTRRRGNGARRSALRWGNRCAISLAKPNAYGLTIGHADIPAEAVQNVFLGTNSVGLVDEVDETALLRKSVSRSICIARNMARLLGQEPQTLDGTVRCKNVNELFTGNNAI